MKLIEALNLQTVKGPRPELRGMRRSHDSRESKLKFGQELAEKKHIRKYHLKYKPIDALRLRL